MPISLAGLAVLSLTLGSAQIDNDSRSVADIVDQIETALSNEDLVGSIMAIGQLDADTPLTQEQRTQVVRVDWRLRQAVNASAVELFDRLPPEAFCAQEESSAYFIGTSIHAEAEEALEACPARAESRFEQDAEPSRRVPPRYPARALMRGIEGSCLAWFDVSPRGRTANVEVLCSNEIFKRSMTRALNRWRYSPRYVHGEAVWRRNVKTVMDYAID